jgi:hypothetical protein
MYGKVKRLRQRGQRLSDRDIANAPFVEGELSLFSMGGVFVLSVRDPNSQTAASLYPELHEARLVGMQRGKMAFKGEERPQGDDGPAFVQEWSVLIAPR